MIHRIYSSLPQFKTLEFHRGLNILLSTKSLGATEKQTRNRAGKSSMVEIIHFLTGADAGPDSLFRKDALVDSSFGMDFDLGDQRITVERSGNLQDETRLIEPIPGNLPLAPTVKRDLGYKYYTKRQWKDVLGNTMFDLPLNARAEWGEYAPTFRMLFAYFVRRDSANAFNSPFTQYDKQATWDKQVAISYLLGLDWTIPQELQTVREEETALKQLRAAAKKGAFQSIIGTSAQLRTDVALADQKVTRVRKNLQGFNVLPEYRELENQVNHITRQQRDLSNNDVIDRQLLDELTRALSAESEPSVQDIDRIYKEAGVILPEIAVRRVEEVRKFHRSVVQNRRSYLQSEIDKANNRIEQRRLLQESLNGRYAEIMIVLDSHGALDQYNSLNQELSRLEAEAADLRNRFETIERLERQETRLEARRGALQMRLQQDYEEHDEVLKEAIVAFAEISSSLYETGTSGSLVVEPKRNGPVFDVQIQGAASTGISNMQIFCFDMMLMLICGKKSAHPDFLVHDSKLFDGVDARQVRRALQLGSSLADEHGFQYIVTLNSDVLSEEIAEGFSMDDYVLPVVLSDETETGGLFGFRFD